MLGAIRVLVAFSLALSAVTGTCAAGPKDYRLELVNKTVKVGAGAVIQIRLVDTSTQKAVADADVRVIALDMSPEGMPAMNAKATPMLSSDTEVHVFVADLTMAGRWAISLEARIPTESAPLRDKLLLKAQR